MKNFGNMMKQAQQMQAKMAEMQERLGTLEISGQSGAGMVTATINGRNEVRALKIDPALLDPAEVEVLEDLVVAALNDARSKVEAAVAEESQRLMGDIKLPPGMKLPF